MTEFVKLSFDEGGNGIDADDVWVNLDSILMFNDVGVVIRAGDHVEPFVLTPESVEYLKTVMSLHRGDGKWHVA